MRYLEVGRLGQFYRENRILVWLSGIIFVTQMGFGSIVPVVPLYARGFGVSQTAIGLTISIYGLARFLANVPTWHLSDRMGRRWTLVLGETISAVGNLLCGLSGSFEQFLVFRFIAGAGAAMTLTSAQVILTDISTTANRGRVMGTYHAVFLFAVGIGPLPGGLLASAFGLNVPFLVFAGMGVLAGVLAFNKVPETLALKGKRSRGAVPMATATTLPLGVQLRMLLSRVGFLLVTLVTFTQYFARTGAIFGVVPVLGAVKLGLSPDQIGLGLTIVAFPDLVMVYFTGVLVDRFGRKPIIVPGAMLAALSLTAFALAPSFGWFALSLALWGVAAGLNVPAPAAYLADMAPPGMNAITTSAYRMIADIGYVIGPLLLGWVSDGFSSEAALLATAALFASSGILFGLFAPETRKRAEPRLATAREG